MHLFPNAKINIGLNVVEKRLDGYHNIETIFLPIGLKDELLISKSDGLGDADYRLKIQNASFAGDAEDNLVIKAYRLLQRDFDLGAVDIELIKNIPSGSGLGGGSSDAAFTLKALNTLFELNLDICSLENYASRLGADCSVFIQNKPVYATGIGDIFMPVNVSFGGYKMLLVAPGLHISTPQAYAAIKPTPSKNKLTDIIRQDISSWRNLISNDFEPYAFEKHPELKDIKDSLYDLGADYASMTGSGSAIYGFFRGDVPNLKLFDKYQIFVESF